MLEAMTLAVLYLWPIAALALILQTIEHRRKGKKQ